MTIRMKELKELMRVLIAIFRYPAAIVVAFVASEGARWITGASIPVDGGSKL